MAPDSPTRPVPVAADDLALMRAVANHDAQAERRLVLRVLPRVRQRAWGLTRNPDDADDGTQAAMLEILGSAKNYAGSGSLEGWCDRIATRTIVRMQRRTHQRDAKLDFSISPDQREAARDEEPMHERIRGEVSEYLEALSDERRHVVVLRHVHDYSIDEIADLTGVSRNTVKDRLRCALEQLRKHIHRAEVIAFGARSQP